jgi:hypothetical protein
MIAGIQLTVHPMAFKERQTFFTTTMVTVRLLMSPLNPTSQGMSGREWV